MDLECECKECDSNDDGWCELGWNKIDENGICDDMNVRSENG